ncbi:MAG: hypothetical protein PVG39_18675 [Desulfobacteraceae bacterium]
MEDNGRELAPDPVETPPVKDRSLDSKELTIMLIGSVGKMRSFKISRKVISYTLVFFSVYIVVSLLIFYLYFDLYATHKTQSINLEKLEAELSDKTKILDKNKLYIKGLEDFYNNTREGTEGKEDTGTGVKKAPAPKSAKVSVPRETKSKKPAPGEMEEKADSGAAAKKAPEPDSPKVNIPDETKSQDTVAKKDVKDSMEVKDISYQRTDSELTLNFKLANKQAEQNIAEGYVHIIVMDKNKECPAEWNNPYNKLSDGFPVDYKHGQQFLIQRFRPYQRKYKTNPDSERPSFIRIIVYDRSGQKILEKEFPVTDESANDPS